jgi:predicted kinase
MLKTRSRENLLLQACIEARQPFVVDNTNPTSEARARYISLAKAAGFEAVGYYFQSRLGDCIRRNRLREGKARVPEMAIGATIKRLQPPNLAEGFDTLYYVRIDEDEKFVVEEWAGEAGTPGQLRQEP